MNPQKQSLLLSLPAELQLTIFEYAIQEEEPLLLNCACDSSYDRNYQMWNEDQIAWEKGKLRAPEQPAVTKTCVMIRDMTLPMFYRLNVFRAHYCYQANKDSAIVWLDRIGPEYRSMMRDVAFWDLNRHFDISVPRDLLQLKRSKICKEMNGTLETIEMEDRCFHKITFWPAVEDEFDGIAELFAS